MDVIETEIPAVKRVRPKRHGDARGWFSETFRADALAAAGIACTFVQDNQSFSAPKGTIRGLHFQVPPQPQAKLIRVLAGAILDVAVDIRRDSPTFGRYVAVILDAEGGEQLFIPHGFAHGFCTLTPDVMVAYKVDSYYSPAHDRALVWNDPEIGIDWPVTEAEAILSDKDRRAPRLADLGPAF
ncbi:dTDP-4-dehydrorhamnose 3,5-epimerase [Methylobacterium gregans]|uniref:dTDP-4-dehydrorhamnose 3,5-epimerase n=1 Tax=Methylobacterium gregans TaxID=374424 RepID=A0AA37MAG6_9HYPH|nr:dTDP-4-dehydrorhamnose 3,5-epimerase [Methylobacterium gregans]MDQ0523472.1 dTDP-4-dehydrorhamnose 3,5-epimerase [Methylobacterium gregans]GJD78840.1 dTDP-4-dehydrorhamnose 3,5-epimerase [Methylobacterium gregans]GLS55934.1 dTDP-4-dehydrorhamnose 3,5-epimerase [Methylobacterium gregans]